MHGEKVQLISLCFGESPVKSCNVAQNPKARPDESDRLVRKIQFASRASDCVLPKKVEVRHSEYIPTGMRLRDNPVRLTALQQSEGVVMVVVPIREEGKFPVFAPTSLLGYQPALICKQKPPPKKKKKKKKFSFAT